ncbi:MAG: ribonuclease P protein component [Limisphaerales bacterium]
MSDAPSGRLTLGRDKRLRSSNDFARIKNQGERLVRGCLILNWIKREEGGVSRLGVVTSKRIGNAVIRSRARRLMREVFRLHQNEFVEPLEMVLIARRSIAEKKLADVERVFLKLASQAGVIAQQQKPNE